MDERPREPPPVRLGGEALEREAGGPPPGEGEGNRPLPGPRQRRRPGLRDPPQPPRRRPGKFLRRGKYEEPPGRVALPLSAAFRNYGPLSGRCPEVLPLPVPRARGRLSLRSLGGGLRSWLAVRGTCTAALLTAPPLLRLAALFRH